MAKIYYRRIKENPESMTLEDVPMRWRAQVEELLKADEDYQDLT